ncbi:MAG: GHMP kinase [Candidatus Limnocylindria bacterium]
MIRRRAHPTGLDGVIVTRTPLRLSFAGGGTDLPAFYERADGAVLSSAIDQYVYVTVKRHGSFFDEPIRVNYARSEMVDRVDDIENDIVRESLRFLGIDAPIYVSVVGDLPASSGLGGSSSFAVGLLNALHAYRGERVTAGQLAEEASHIEIDVLGQTIGKQDQYAAAFGGLNLYTFRRGGSTSVEPIQMGNGVAEALFERVMLFWTGQPRDAAKVLREQSTNTPDRMDMLTEMREHAHQLRDILRVPEPDLTAVGRTIDRSWALKRGLASTISSSTIDRWHDLAMEAGADGGKVVGAGGGGFLMFLVPPACREAVRAALADLVEVPVRHEVHGSQVALPFLHT